MLSAPKLHSHSVSAFYQAPMFKPETTLQQVGSNNFKSEHRNIKHIVATDDVLLSYTIGLGLMKVWDFDF